MQVRVTDPAEQDFDAYIARPGFPTLELIGAEGRAGIIGGVAVGVGH
jgi:hypothetical protein